MKKQLLSALLAGCLMVGCIGPVSAEEITTSGGNGETPVVLTAEAMTFSVTVPMALSVGVAADGTVTTADNVKIINNSSGPVKVESVTASAVGDWEMAAWSETDTLSGEKVGVKKFALSINGTGIAADGFCGATFDSIAAKGELPFEYAAHVAPQATAITAEDNEQMARVVFTIGWDEEVPAVDFEVTKENRSMVGYTGEENENLVIPATFVGEDGKWYKVTGIEGYAFEDSTSLTSIAIPDSVTKIGVHAFYNCASLTSVNIPDGVKYIEEGAFSNCRALTSITIPDGVKYIGNGAFCNCTSFTSIEIPDSVTSIGNGAFIACTSLTSITIPDSVTKIGDEVFSSCKALSSITIPDSVTKIGKGAFENCTNLTSVNIPEGIAKMEQNIFHNCTSLISITIPDSVTNIGRYAFDNCVSLTSVNIPDGVTSIEISAFGNCRTLTSITYKGTEYHSVNEFEAAFNDGEHTMV